MLKAIRGKSWSNPSTNNAETSNESATASVSDIGENESQLGSVSISSTSQTTQLDQDEDRDHQWVQYQKLTNDRLKAATSAYAVHLAKKKPLPFNVNPSELQEIASSLDQDPTSDPKRSSSFQFPKLNLTSLINSKDERYTPLESLAISMLTTSNLLNSIDQSSHGTTTTPYSSSLSVLASTQFSIANLQSQLHSDLQDFLNRLARSNVDLQAFQNAKKKLEEDQNKWLNAKKKKENARKEKEKREAEDEERDTRAAYDHSVSNLQTILDSLTSTSTSTYELSSLTDFLHSQLHYISQSYEVLMRAKESLSLILQGAEANGYLPSGTNLKSRTDLDSKKNDRNRKDSKSSTGTVKKDQDQDDYGYGYGEEEEEGDTKDEIESSSKGFKRPFLNRKSSSKSEKSLNGSHSILPNSFRRPKTSEGSPKIGNSSPSLKGGSLIAKTLSSNSNNGSNTSFSKTSTSNSAADEDGNGNGEGGETLTKKNRGRFSSFGASVGSVIASSKPSIGHRTVSSVDVKSNGKDESNTSSNSNSSQTSSNEKEKEKEKFGSTSNWTGFMRKKESNGFQEMNEGGGGGFSASSSNSIGLINNEKEKTKGGRGRSISMLSSKSNSNEGGKNSSTPRLLKKELKNDEDEERRRIDLSRNFEEDYSHQEDDEDLFDPRPSMAINEPMRERNLEDHEGGVSLGRGSHDILNRSKNQGSGGLPLSPIPVSPNSADFNQDGWTSFKPEINHTGGSIDSHSNPLSPTTMMGNHSNYPSENDSLGLNHSMSLAPEHTGISLGAFSDGGAGDDPFNRNLRSPSPRISTSSDHHHHPSGMGIGIGHTPMGSFGDEVDDYDDETEALTSNLKSEDENGNGNGVTGFKGSGNLNQKRGPPPPIPSSSNFLSRKSNPPPPPPPISRGGSTFGGMFKK